MNLRFYENCYGSSNREISCTIQAKSKEDNDAVVGALDIVYHFVAGEKQAYINMIQVLPEYQKLGVAKELILYLTKTIPYHLIDWGTTTKEGKMLKASFDKKFGVSYKASDESQSNDDSIITEIKLYSMIWKSN